MRRLSNKFCLTAALAISFAALQAQSSLAQSSPDQDHAPCRQIRAACEQAGFKPGGAHEGIGIQSDCIHPLMQGTPQRAKAAKPLPTVDPALIAACKAKNPNFGEHAQNGKMGANPAGAKDAPSSQMAPAPAPSSGQQ